MKQAVSIEARQRVLELRRRHSLREVAERSGLPLGTVKTICSRSGAFRDNEQHRALFSLPPIRESKQTLPAIPELPQQRPVTGDKEVDAVLWLREVIGTGQAAMIEKAMQAATKVKAPLDKLERRYRDWLTANHPGNLFAALSSFDFANLEGHAKKSIKKAAHQHEAHSRFGDTLFEETEAERFCIAALAGVEPDKFGAISDDVAAERFHAHPELLPRTLSDCLHELAYWSDLHRLRYSVAGTGSDGPVEAYERRRFAFRCLAEIRPRSKHEALDVLQWMLADRQNNAGNDDENDAIMLNLIG